MPSVLFSRVLAQTIVAVNVCCDAHSLTFAAPNVLSTCVSTQVHSSLATLVLTETVVSEANSRSSVCALPCSCYFSFMRRENQAPHEAENGWSEELEAKQRNLVWPDTMRNSRGVDVLFFKGDPKAPTVQRVGCWVFGISMFFVTATSIAELLDSKDAGWAIMAIFSGAFGGWVFSRGFVGLRKRQR
jgi:hypothetical protein